VRTGVGNAAAIADALSARAEAMNFQILEMQDQMQKMQEANETRFQFLETGKRAETDVQQAGGNTSLADAGSDQGNNGNLDGGVSKALRRRRPASLPAPIPWLLIRMRPHRADRHAASRRRRWAPSASTPVAM
jgi:TolA-binding protein